MNGYLALNLLFFPLMIASGAALWWAKRESTKAGIIWPTEKCLGVTIRHRFQRLLVIQSLHRRIRDVEDPAQASQYRRWLIAILVSYGLGLLALIVLAAFSPWLYSQVR